MEDGGISSMGRSTSGVKVMTLDEDIKISAIAKVGKMEENDEEE